MNIGITGESGFMGTHLSNWLRLEDDIQLIHFEDAYFESVETMRTFVKQCDVIVHLAAMNRHSDLDILYETNVSLVRKLIAALEDEGATPHVIFSSSIQENRDNKYGQSKLEGRRLFDEWAQRSGGRFTGMIVPNVFGPFGQPNYNSVIATFCHQVMHDQNPKIETDGLLHLIYINDLSAEFARVIRGEVDDNPYYVPHRAEKRVSEILEHLNAFKISYIENSIIPDLNDRFTSALFNTFSCCIDHKTHFPKEFSVHADERGSFVEVVRLDHTGGQISFSTTKPGVTRGNHFHTRKYERFAVIRGKARISLRRVGCDKIVHFELEGNRPAFVDIPIWHTHNITNIGDDELYTIFWINEPYDPSDADTFFEDV